MPIRQNFHQLKLKYVYELELQIMKSNNKESSPNLKWKKFINSLINTS